MVGVNVKVRKNVGKPEMAAFMLRMKQLGIKPRGVAVGISAETGARVSEKSKKTVLEYAEANEFGLGVPERSFLRAWFDTFEPLARAQMKAILTQVVDGKTDIDTAMNRMGARFVAQCQKNIVDGGNPPFLPNAPLTVHLKGSSSPLIDNGLLKAAITFVLGGSR